MKYSTILALAGLLIVTCGGAVAHTSSSPAAPPGESKVVSVCDFDQGQSPQCPAELESCFDMCLAEYMTGSILLGFAGAAAAICHGENTWSLAECMSRCRDSGLG